MKTTFTPVFVSLDRLLELSLEEYIERRVPSCRAKKLWSQAWVTWRKKYSHDPEVDVIKNIADWNRIRRWRNLGNKLQYELAKAFLRDGIDFRRWPNVPKAIRALLGPADALYESLTRSEARSPTAATFTP